MEFLIDRILSIEQVWFAIVFSHAKEVACIIRNVMLMNVSKVGGERNFIFSLIHQFQIRIVDFESVDVAILFFTGNQPNHSKVFPVRREFKGKIAFPPSSLESVFR